MNPVPRRVEHDHVRLFLDFIEHPEHISRDKPAVRQPVMRGIFPCRRHGLLHDFHPDYLLGDGSQHLRDRAGSTKQVEHRLVPQVSRIFAHRTVKHLCRPRIGLEEGKRRNLEFHFQKLFVEIILAIQNPRLVTLHHVGQRVIENVKNPHDSPL